MIYDQGSRQCCEPEVLRYRNVADIEENGDPKAPDLQAPEFFFGDFGTTHAATAPAMSTLFPLDDESLSYWVWDNNDPRADSWTYDQEAALIDVELSHIDEPVPSSEMSLRNTQAIISGTTAWTDSGYGSNSKLEPGFQLDGLNKMNAAEMHDLTDSATCFLGNTVSTGSKIARIHYCICRGSRRFGTQRCRHGGC